MTPLIDTLRLTAEEAPGCSSAARSPAPSSHGAYLDAIDERDAELHAYLRTSPSPNGPTACRSRSRT